MSSTLDAILNETLPADLSSMPIDEVREVRTRLKSVEDGLSYLRRQVQGRLDVVAAEQARRADGADATIDEMISRLPHLLAASTRSAAPNRPPQRLDPGVVDPELSAALDEIVGQRNLVEIHSLADEELWSVEAELSELERTVSGYRRRIFDRLDGIEAELTRRYRTGEQSVDDLLGR